MLERIVADSFRDPDGFCYFENGVLFRKVNFSYKEDYDALLGSGLYKALVERKLLIPHEEIDSSEVKSGIVYRVIKPEAVPFISYPFEWCFSQLKQAALTTLEIQKSALSFNMSLKDSSAYNIQFKGVNPVFIDTLSFERYKEGLPWFAYKQFCQHFLAPLALMRFVDTRLNQLSRIYIDGIPLDLTSSLLPFQSFLKLSLLSHIHLHAKSQMYFADKDIKKINRKLSHIGLLALLDNLESFVKKLKLKIPKVKWLDYYSDNNYSSAAFNNKKQIVVEYLDKINPGVIWDFGANTGLFSQIAAEKAKLVVSFDADHDVVEKNYFDCLLRKEEKIIPLVMDLTNPSPSIGWQNRERMSLFERGGADAVLALALVHHLAISNNLPFSLIADFFRTVCRFLIIEFVPKDDSQVKRLLASREDIFSNYTQEAFENEFERYFIIEESIRIKDSKRVLYLMKKK